MNVLVVEDDEFKASDLIKIIEDVFGDAECHRAASVTSALRAISALEFGLCVLDMSLPTFDLTGPGGGGSPQSQGGIEVLRLAKRLPKAPPFIVVTQYPEIDVGEGDVPLSIATDMLRGQFNVNVMDCIFYDFDSNDWKDPLRVLLQRILNEGAAK